jgi:hypothetical protein
MKCGACDEPPAGACTACGAYWCERHRRSWFGQALCAACYEKTVHMQAIGATLFVASVIIFLVMLWACGGR